MKYCKSLFPVCFLFIASTAWSNPVTVFGYITSLRFFSDVNSLRFILEYGMAIEAFDHANPNHHAMEVVTLSGPEGFEKHSIVIMGSEIATLISALTGHNALHSISREDNVLHERHSGALEFVVSLPELEGDILLEIERFEQYIYERTSGQYDYARVTYRILEFRSFGDITYLAVGFSDDYRSYGGIIYTIDSNGEIVGKKMLVEDMFISTVDFVRMLSVDRMLLIYVMDAQSPTEISVVYIPEIPISTTTEGIPSEPTEVLTVATEQPVAVAQYVIASPLTPPWTLLVVIGGAAVAVGLVSLAAKRKK